MEEDVSEDLADLSVIFARPTEHTCLTEREDASLRTCLWEPGELLVSLIPVLEAPAGKLGHWMTSMFPKQLRWI